MSRREDRPASTPNKQGSPSSQPGQSDPSKQKQDQYSKDQQRDQSK